MPPRSRRFTSDLPLYSSKTHPPLTSFTLATYVSRPPRNILIIILLLSLYMVFHTTVLSSFHTTLCPPSTETAVLDTFAESAATSHRSPNLQSLTTLILVAGHAIFTGSTWTSDALADESNWILESFQQGQVSTFLAHIRKGVQLAANDSSALLLFSGGQTREGAGPRSEGLTYWLAADSANWYGMSEVKNRTLAEEYARDSLENLLFSVCRFSQVVGRYPHKIKVVSFGFKRTRFVEVHRKALRFPAHRFEFYGVDPDGNENVHDMSEGERQKAMGPFANDPYGCNTKVLSEKKLVRNPYLRYHSYPQGCPELAPLFRHCGRDIFDGPLPWDPRVHPSIPDRAR